MGMPEPLVDPIVDPRPDAVPEAIDVPDVAAEPHADVAAEPPPSNAEFEFVVGHGIWSGLMPDVLSSVAPSGIPLALELDEGSESIVPSGEVAPMPGGRLVCALAIVAPASHMIAAKTRVPCIKISRVSGLTLSTTVL
jgi:hypothetical protein